MTKHEINFSDGRNGGAYPAAGADVSSALSGGDVMGLLMQPHNRPTTRADHEAGIVALFGQLGASDLARVAVVDAEPMPEKRPLKVERQAAKFLKEELGVTEQYIDGDTVHFKLEKPIQKQFPGAPPIWFDKEVNFKIKANGDKIELTTVNGIMARPDYSPWIYIAAAKFERHTDEVGNETGCTADIRGGRLKVYLDKSIPIPSSVFKHVQQAVEDNPLK